MTQGWNRQLQNMQRLMDEYANAINLRDQGFQLGESGNLRRPGNFSLGEAGPIKTGKTVPTVYKQLPSSGYVPLFSLGEAGPIKTGKTVPTVYKQPQGQAMLPGSKTPLLPSSGYVPLLTTSGKPLPQQSIKGVNTLGERTGYVLKDGTVVGKNTLDLINEAQKKSRMAQKKSRMAQNKMMGGTAAVGILGALEAIPYVKRRALLDKVSKDPRLTDDQRSLIEGLKTKELINSYIGGIGTGAITGASSVAGHPYIGATASSPLTQGLIKINNVLWNAGLRKGLKDNFSEEDIKALLFGNYKNKVDNTEGVKEDTSKQNSNAGNTKAIAQSVVNAVANSQPQSEQILEGGVMEEAIPNEVSTILQQAKDRNALYINALNEYLKNYPKNLENAKRSDLYFYGANLGYGLDPRAGQKFNAIQNEADMVNTIKAINDAKNAGVDYANEVAGNSAIAQDIGLPQKAAFANKNLLSAYFMRERDKVRQAIADANNLVRRYGIDKRAAMQLAIQNLRNENALAVAAMYSGMGYPGVGLTPTGQAQSTSVAPVQYPQQQVQSVDPRQQYFD